MSRGRCFLVDVGGSKGCFADVMAEFDAWCSGRRSCDILVRDLLVVRKRPCPIGLSKYLAAEYTCLHGEGIQSCARCVTNAVGFPVAKHGTNNAWRIGPTLSSFSKYLVALNMSFTSDFFIAHQ